MLFSVENWSDFHTRAYKEAIYNFLKTFLMHGLVCQVTSIQAVENLLYERPGNFSKVSQNL